ncbi:MAG: purine phosphorylase [Pseudomonadota bacterium]|nr:purine phosphorylase [Pseudomonadota bacterium]
MKGFGIVAALPAEVRALAGTPAAVGSVAQLSDQAILALSGTGPERARAAGKRLLAEGARGLVSWGVAAALDPCLRAGSLVLPVRVFGLDTGTYEAHPGWHRRLVHCLSRHLATSTGPLVETPVLLTDPVHKRALFERSQAIAADMESAALAKLAQEAGAAFVAIRSISDTASMSLPQWLVSLVDEVGRVDPARLAKALFVSPGRAGDLARLAFGFRAAKATLRNVAENAGRDLLFQVQER